MSAALEKSLDDIIGERAPEKKRGPTRREPRGPRRDPYSRPPRRHEDSRDEYRGPERSRWSHDRYSPKRDSEPRSRHNDRDSKFTLRVSNIHYDLTEDDLRSLFDKIAPVEHFKLHRDRSGRSDGRCTVTYAEYRDAKDAIREYDGQLAMAQRLVVEFAEEERPQRDSGRDLASRIARDPPRNTARRGGGREERNGRSTKSAKRGPATAQDLDAELESFMKQRNDPVANEGPANDGMQVD